MQLTKISRTHKVGNWYLYQFWYQHKQFISKWYWKDWTDVYITDFNVIISQQTFKQNPENKHKHYLELFINLYFFLFFLLSFPYTCDAAERK